MKNLILHNYIPEKSIKLIENLLEEYHFYLIIKNNRKTKHGDFRLLKNGNYQITINNDLNKYRFLITLIHEIAHLKTHQENKTIIKQIKPHGIEWKLNFQQLMLPFLTTDIFPDTILRVLANYLRNPKASTDSDVHLSLKLKEQDAPNNKTYIFEIPLQTKFKYNNRIFVKGNKRRTRYECTEIKTDKKYLFHQNAEVLIIEL
ncbi:MAG TPA: ImmA/IrrE family metallo-endopeptidase [Flavobacteriia bacterium]|nr:ImmA/IrrE family metallo-endopeptidase [Flavobacteriia bacterium]